MDLTNEKKPNQLNNAEAIQTPPPPQQQYQQSATPYMKSQPPIVKLRSSDLWRIFFICFAAFIAASLFIGICKEVVYIIRTAPHSRLATPQETVYPTDSTAAEADSCAAWRDSTACDSGYQY